MIDFRVERSWNIDGYQMWLMDRRNGRAFIAKPITLEFEPIQEGQLLPTPTLQIHGELARDLIPQMRKAMAGLTWFEDKEDYEASKRIEKAMQAHIDSLKLVVERTVRVNT